MAEPIMASGAATSTATAGRVIPGAANAVYVVVPVEYPILLPDERAYGEPVRALAAASAAGEKPEAGDTARYYAARTPTKAFVVADAIAAQERAPYVVEERPSRGGVISAVPTARWRSVAEKNAAGLPTGRKWVTVFHARDPAHTGASCEVCGQREAWNAERAAAAKARRDARLRVQQQVRVFVEEAASLAPHHDRLDALFEDYAPVYSMLAEARLRCGFRELARAL